MQRVGTAVSDIDTLYLNSLLRFVERNGERERERELLVETVVYRRNRWERTVAASSCVLTACVCAGCACVRACVCVN